MAENNDQLKLLYQELKKPYRQLNYIFLLISVIPVLSCLYILCDKQLDFQKTFQEIIPILLFSNLIVILGYVVGYGVIKHIIRKITMYASRATRADEQRSTMALSLAHDLKSPLAVIKANMSNMRARFLGPLTPQHEEAVKVCTDVANRMDSILMNLIRTYTLEDATAELNKENFDLRELLEEQEREAAALAQDKYVSIDCVLSKKPVMIFADRSMIVRAVNNLLNNAIKYTSKNGKIILRTFPADGLAHMEVLNTGKVIPEESLEKIFERYERLDRSVPGEGLGLTIARSIVEQHQGKIWAESGPGKPNSFIVLLPLAKEPDNGR